MICLVGSPSLLCLWRSPILHRFENGPGHTLCIRVSRSLREIPGIYILLNDKWGIKLNTFKDGLKQDHKQSRRITSSRPTRTCAVLRRSPCWKPVGVIFHLVTQGGFQQNGPSLVLTPGFLTLWEVSGAPLGISLQRTLYSC